MMLDWEEFYAMQPRKLREQFSAKEIRAWFDAADSDGNGVLSISEFFIYSLSGLGERFGASSLEQMFAKFDETGTGSLDVIEFEKLAAAFGFAVGSDAIFRAIDTNSTGTHHPRAHTVPALTTAPVHSRLLTVACAICVVQARSRQRSGVRRSSRSPTRSTQRLSRPSHRPCGRARRRMRRGARRPRVGRRPWTHAAGA